jgi:hypothetical protein
MNDSHNITEAEMEAMTTRIAEAAGSEPTEGESRLAADRVKRQLRKALPQFLAEPGIAGRIRPRETDGASQAWRYARWPLAAVASLVAGLVVVSFFADTDSLDNRYVRGGGVPQPAAVDEAAYLEQVDLIFDSPTVNTASEAGALAWVDADDIVPAGYDAFDLDDVLWADDVDWSLTNAAVGG